MWFVTFVAFAVAADDADFSSLPESATVTPIEPDGKPHPVTARLLTDVSSLQPGSRARIAVKLEQAPGWHTYWKSPGGIGQPTEITWTLPDPLSAQPYQYPTPERFVQDDIVSYGYEHGVLLVSDLIVPADLTAGKLTLAAHVQWLVCNTTCRPGEADLVLAIDAGPPAPTPTPWARLFDEAAAQQPLAAVPGLEVETALNVAALTPGAPFQMAIHLRWADGHPMPAPSAEVWPQFAPLVLSYDAEVAETRLVATPNGGLLAILSGTAFEPDPLPTTDRLGGLFQVEDGGKTIVTEISAPLPWRPVGTPSQASLSPLFALAGATPGDAASGVASVQVPEAAPLSFAMNLLWAFIGGLLLNIMPCVLPVLTLKLYGLIEQSDITVADQRRAGIAYTSGIVASFWLLAIAVVLLRSMLGVQVDWGFQFQFPPYVAALATVVFLFGLSLFGVFEIPAFGASSAGAATEKEGVLGYFFTGVFATLLATPCSAPFLGTAVAFAFASPAFELVTLFSFIGFGLAAPFLFVAFVPAAYRLLPRPGAWMEAFKQLLGFSLIATTVWLVDVLGAQVGADGTTGFLGFLIFAGMAAWGFGRWGGVGATGMEQLRAFVVAALVMAGGGWWLLDLDLAPAETCDKPTQTDVDWSQGHIPWQPFSEKAIVALASKPVFVDFTADWCLTCKINERAILETQTVRDKLEACGVVPLKADWTRRDDEITAWLHRFGRAGVPFYLVIPANGGTAIPLPEVITPLLVTAAIDQACVVTP